VVHPGAASPARRWPAERWASVASHAAARGARVVVTGTAAERSTAREVAARAGLAPAAVLAGRTDLLRLAALVAHARCVLSGDTGVAHLAAAFGTPSVVLFGPTSPAEWGPPVDGPHEVLWAGATGDPHGAELDDGLAEIGAEDVVAALDRALA
jgi:ADP-heptose:LPS heptosyltransferase